MRNALFLLCFFLVAQLLRAQSNTPLHFSHNPANAGVNNLFFHDNLCHKFLFIYTQAEIAAMTTPVTGPILIDTIWFRHGGGSSTPTTVLSNLVVTLGHSTLATPVATFANNFNAGPPATVVNTPALAYTPLIGNWNQPSHNWTYIVLQTPFAYNFTDNLAVQFEFSASSGFIVGHYADNGGIPITQYDASNTATTASSTTARPMFGISPGCGQPMNLGPDSVLCGQANYPLTANVNNATYLWSTGATTQNISATTSGTYWVNVTDSCGTRTDTVNLTFSSIPQAGAGNDVSICAGSSVSLNASGGTAYSWSPASGLSDPSIANPSASPVTTSTYVVTASSNGCSDNDTVVVTVNPLPTISASADTTIIFGQSATLGAGGGVSYSWSPNDNLSCSTCASTIASPTVTTTYTVTVTDANGCSSIETITVIVDLQCGEVFVPGAFSPNGDGINDLLCVFGNCITTIDFTIYDRWGEVVYHTDEKGKCWSGAMPGAGEYLNTAVFVYRLEAELVNGEKISKQGTIHLMR